MIMRTNLEKDLRSIHNQLIKMGTLIEEAIGKTMTALKSQDRELANEVIGEDDQIDSLEKEIEKKCIEMIALQQPMATDLREILSILKMITDLERIGDHCSDISMYTIKLANEKYVKPLVHIPEMAENVSRMVKMTIDSYIHRDATTAQLVCDTDDLIDNYFESIIKELEDIMKENGEKISQCLSFIFIVKYLERMADHATNACEWIIYNITGKHESLN